MSSLLGKKYVKLFMIFGFMEVSISGAWSMHTPESEVSSSSSEEPNDKRYVGRIMYTKQTENLKIISMCNVSQMSDFQLNCVLQSFKLNNDIFPEIKLYDVIAEINKEKKKGPLPYTLHLRIGHERRKQPEGFDIYGTSIALYPSLSNRPMAASTLYNSSSYDDITVQIIPNTVKDYVPIERIYYTDGDELTYAPSNILIKYESPTQKEESYLANYIEMPDGRKFMGIPTNGIECYCAIFSLGLDFHYLYYPEIDKYSERGINTADHIYQKIADDFLINIHRINGYVDPDTRELWSEYMDTYNCSVPNAPGVMDVYYQSSKSCSYHASMLIPLNDDFSVKEGYMGLLKRQTYMYQDTGGLIGHPLRHKKPDNLQANEIPE
jgi:hypothetical protein